MIFAHTALVVILLVLTFWRRDIFLYIVSCPVLVTFGLRWYDLYHNAAGLTLGLAMLGLGIYCIVLAVVNLLRR